MVNAFRQPIEESVERKRETRFRDSQGAGRALKGLAGTFFWKAI